MTFEQAIETVSKSKDEKERCSAIVALTDHMERATAVLTESAQATGKVKTYADAAMRRVHAASAR